MKQMPKYVIGLLFILVFSLIVILYFYSPLEYGFYPGCPFFKITGYKCPLCGGLRAVHELSHGHVTEAFHYNALLVIAIPVIFAVFFVEIARFYTKKTVFIRILAYFNIKVLIVIVLLWWVTRNFAGI